MPACHARRSWPSWSPWPRLCGSAWTSELAQPRRHQPSHLRQIQLALGAPPGLTRRHAGPELLVQSEPAAVEVCRLIRCSKLGHRLRGVIEPVAELAGEVLLDP